MKLLYILLSFSIFTLSYGKDFKIKVIYDSSIDSSKTLKIYSKEIKSDFNGTDYTPKFELSPVSSLKDYKREVSSINTKEADAVLLLDSSVSKMSLTTHNYPLPTIASMGLLPAKNIPHNLNYIHIKDLISSDFKLLRDLSKKNNLLITVSNKSTVDSVFNINKDFGFNITVVDPTSISSKKMDNIDIIYILEGDNSTIKSLAVNNGTPIISRVSSLDNDEDISLVYFDPLADISIRARVSGINLLEIAKGKDVKSITSEISASDNSAIFNLSQAKKLKVFPDIKYLQKVSLIEGKKRKTKPLDFHSGVEISLQENLKIKSSIEDIKTSKYDVTTAKSERRPSASTYAQYSSQDSKGASVPWTGPQDTVRGGVSLMYTIFDDEINAEVAVSKLTNRSKEYKYQNNRLDTINNFGNTYLQILKLQEDINIEKANYKLLKKYLHIAETNYRAGASDKEDIYRFQSEIASSLSNIFQLKGSLKTEQSKLNLILNRTQDNIYYNLQVIDENDEPFKALSTAIKSIGFDLSKEDKLRRYLSELAVKNSFDIKIIDVSINSKSKELGAAKRLRYTPKVSATGDLSKDLIDSWGTGASDDDDSHWQAGLKIEIPLVKGGAIESQKDSLTSQMNSLKYQRESIIASIIQDTLSNLNNVEKSFYQTETIKENLDASIKNLDLIEGQYVQGAISISDLLDAKTTFIQAKSDSNINKYEYLGFILDLEKNIGKDFFPVNTIKEDKDILKLNEILKDSGGVL